jgi:valyl-tRNA synthetase
MLAATERALRLLHPVAPFITEELWQRLTVNTPGRAKSLALARYPRAKAGRRDAAAERQVDVLQEATTGVRNLRAEMNIPPRNPLTGILYSPSADVRAVASEQADALERLACVTLSAVEGHCPEGKATHHTAEFDLEIELPEEQKHALKAKLAKQLESLEKAAGGARKQLGNEAFLAKAPDAVVAGIKEKLADYESQIERIQKTIG